MLVPKYLSKSEKLEKTWTSHKRFLFFLSFFGGGSSTPTPFASSLHIVSIFFHALELSSKNRTSEG